MPVMRVNKNKNYTTMSNRHLRDLNLSLKARGLLSTILSLPDNWNYSISGLVAICKENESSVKSALNELKNAGYMVVERLYSDESGTGKFKYVYNIFENPEDSESLKEELNKKEILRASRGENPPVENPPMEDAQVENHPLNKYTDKRNTDKLNKEILNTENINASTSKEVEGDMDASHNSKTVTQRSEEEQKIYCPRYDYTDEQLEDYIRRKIPILIESAGGLSHGSENELIKIILLFYKEYNKRYEEKHRILADESFINIILEYDNPPDTMYGYGAYECEDYREMIEKYFEVDFGKYGNSDFGTRIPIKRLLSHFMSDSIREHIYRQITGL